MLEPPERRHVVEAAAVDVHLAGAQVPGDTLGALDVGRPDAAGEAVVGVVGEALLSCCLDLLVRLW